MDPAAWHGVWPYLAVAAAAALEGEALYSAAAVLVGMGRLDGPLVAIAGTLGAAAGDQFYFYLLRGRLGWLLDRVGFIASRRPLIVDTVRNAETLLILAIRFSPGFRIALAAACAYAGVSAWRFSLLNLLAASVWAVGLLIAIAWLGPAVSARFGLSGAWAAIIPAIVLIAVGRAVGRASRATLARPEAEKP